MRKIVKSSKILPEHAGRSRRAFGPRNLIVVKLKEVILYPATDAELSRSRFGLVVWPWDDPTPPHPPALHVVNTGPLPSSYRVRNRNLYGQVHGGKEGGCSADTGKRVGRRDVGWIASRASEAGGQQSDGVALSSRFSAGVSS